MHNSNVTTYRNQEQLFLASYYKQSSADIKIYKKMIKTVLLAPRYKTVYNTIRYMNF